MSTMPPVIKTMVKAVHRASKPLIRDFGELEKLQISEKGPRDFVTHADLRTEKLLVDFLSTAYPDDGFLLEEQGEIKGGHSKYRWIIDPIDGTINFMHGVSQFCISIALEGENYSGEREMTAALIYAPVTREYYWALRGTGAFLESADGHVTRLRVSGRKKLNTSLMAIGSLRHGDAVQKNIIEHFGELVAGIRCTGSSALDLAHVAAGKLDFYVQEQIEPWDMAAGLLLIKEAGGHVSTFKGGSDMLQKRQLVATNGHLHNTVIKSLPEVA